MSLFLCRQEPVKHPFYISELDIRIYSSQELSYVIINNPLLVRDGFVNERLLLFLRDQLDMGFLSLKMDRLRKAGESDLEILCLFLQEADYCLADEIARFRTQFTELNKMPAARYQKVKAEYLYRIGQYVKAISELKKITEMPRNNLTDESFLGMVYSNIGSCYVQLLQYERAVKAFEKSYFYVQDENTLKYLYFLSEIESGLFVSVQCRQMMTAKLKELWKTELTGKREQIAHGDEKRNLDELFSRDPIRRKQGAEAQIRTWKQKYHSMQNLS